MALRTLLAGRFERINEAYLRKRADRQDDPRHEFYLAMLTHGTYEAYEAAVQGRKVFVPSYGNGQRGITGRDEILYARRRRWIVDAPG